VGARATTITGKRLVLFVIAGLLTIAAALAIGILLFGDFGATEGRVLATTALLAAYGVLALPAAILSDQRRRPALAFAVAALAVAGASLTIASVWTEQPPDVLGKSSGTVNAWLVAFVQIAVLDLRRREHDHRFVRSLFVVSSALVVVLAGMVSTLIWAGFDSERYGRALGALLVLDVLCVALQPVLARARQGGTVHRLRLRTVSGAALELTVEAPDRAAAAAKAIRQLERDRRDVVHLEFADAALPVTRFSAAGGSRPAAPARERPPRRTRRDAQAPG
jgi:hypothetical protein